MSAPREFRGAARPSAARGSAGRAPTARAALLSGATALLAGALLGAGAAPQGPLAVSDTGRGDPCIVLVHGIGVARGSWDAVAKRLAEHHRVLAVDLPGHGGSAALDSVTVDRVADALEATLAARDIRRAVLVGHSYGGLVVLAEAAAHPKRARGVAVVDIAAWQPLDPAQVAQVEQIMTERYPIFIQAVFETMSADSTVREELKESARAVPQEVVRAYFRDAWRADLRPSVKRLEAPLLVVTGPALWPASQPWDSVRVHLGYAGARRATGARISGTGHFIPLDRPDTLATVLGSFVAGLR